MPATAADGLGPAAGGAPSQGGGETTRSVWSLGVVHFTASPTRCTPASRSAFIIVITCR